MCDKSGTKRKLIATPIGLEGDSSKLTVKQQEDFCDLSKQPEIIQWMEKVGIIVYKKSREKGFSVVGSLYILSHAYIEQATTEKGRKVSYQTNNWWNFGALKSRNQKVCKGISSFACFDSLDEAYEAYYDRITSTEDLIAYKNPNHNPSYPLLGKLFKKENAPSEKEINEATRILVNGKEGGFIYCGDGHKLRYAKDMISCSKTAKKDILTYITRRLKCLEQQKPQSEDSKSTSRFLPDFYLAFKLPALETDEVTTEKSELEKIKQEIESKGNV
jgi:hypothetical protein